MVTAAPAGDVLFDKALQGCTSGVGNRGSANLGILVANAYYRYLAYAATASMKLLMAVLVLFFATDESLIDFNVIARCPLRPRCQRPCFANTLRKKPS